MNISKVLLLLLLLPTVFAEIYVVTLDTQAFSVLDIYVKTGTVSIKEVQPNTMRFELLSEKGDILLEGSLPHISTIPPLSSASEEDLRKNNITREEIRKDELAQDIVHPPLDPEIILRIPYHPLATTLLIYWNGKMISEKILAYSDLCGDNTCQEHESSETCSHDCPSGGQDDFCDNEQDNICDPDCLKDEDCKKSETQISYEKLYVCDNDGYCGAGEDKNNCPADCRQSVLPYLISICLVLAAILFIRRKRT